MHFLNRLAAVTLLGILNLGGAIAADAADDADRRERGAEKMQQKLDLTDEQSSQVQAIMREQGEKHRAIEEETQQRLGKVLTPDQMQRMDRKWSGHHERHRDGARGSHMTRDLDLKPEQEQAVEDIFADAREQHMKLSRSDLDRGEKRAQKDALHKQVREKLAGILTPEQLATFDEMHARHGEHGGQRGDKREDSGKQPESATGEQK